MSAAATPVVHCRACGGAHERGALPAHGVVTKVAKDQYCDEVVVEISIGEPPAAAAAETTPEAGKAA